MRSLIILGIVVWLSAAVLGVAWLTQFENTAAQAVGVYPASFPADSRLERDEMRPTLILFAHPKCPCTRATLNELSRLTTDINGRTKAYVVFIKPKDASNDWLDTDIVAIAKSIPGVAVVIDEDERETRIFNGQTSGITLLYDREGYLRFQGGITASRGHEGDNVGRAAIFEIVTADAAITAQTSVFGCPLFQKDCPGEQTPAATDKAGKNK